MDSVKIKNKVYDRQSFLNTTDVSFKELFTSVIDDDSIPTIEELFTIYNQLFYIIPKEGEYSHTTLVTQSSEYLGITLGENIDTSALLDEITSLREQLYSSQLNYDQLLKAQ